MEGSDGAVTARVLFESTNGTSVNAAAHSKARSPVASDVKRWTREQARVSEAIFCCSSDAKEAHRQFAVHCEDRHLLGCQLDEGEEVSINTLGAFRVSSASYYWSWVELAIGRFA